MLSAIRRMLGRRKFAPVVKRLPAWLKHNFGAHDHYSPGQVRRAAAELRLDDVSTTISLAACCTADDFRSACPAGDANAYHAFRGQLADMFQIPTHDFTVRDLRRLGVEPASSTSSNPESGGSSGG